jgi:hypothetical protein
MNLSFHAQQRARQRGTKGSDINLIVIYGTETRDGYFLRHKDIEDAEKEHKKKLYRLSGRYVVVKDDTVITVYHPCKQRRKRVLRSWSIVGKGKLEIQQFSPRLSGNQIY